MLKLDHHHNIIEIKQLSFAYKSQLILDQISLNIHQGDYLGIVGPNGAGKTTLLKILLRLLTSFQGQIKLFGVDIKDFRDYSKISYVPQQATNFDTNFPVTVREVVSMGRYARRGLFHRLDSQDFKIIDDSLEQVRMREYQQELIGNLSGGQAQRVFIARALVSQPELIFLDEPTTGIDQESQDDFYKLLKNLNQSMGLSLVLVSHDTARLTREVMHIAYLDRLLTYYNSPNDFSSERRFSDNKH